VFDEFDTKDVDVVGPSIVTQVPDDLSPGLASCAQHRQNARKIVAIGRRLNQMPANAVTRDVYSAFVQTLVILDNMPVMSSRSSQIETPTGKELMRGTLESSDEETGKERSSIIIKFTVFLGGADSELTRRFAI